ncbi:MAG: hypothetical protein DI586_02710 [Micavibrio aeruginosavorus]|uniref:Uncharacterized protein n=1 Tax=Micavibrio aeruginosavorus TaxID=349221 RepID=A0A2W5FSF7_9BACT|nr:MAG: hypothetical protein DI586_02710 [Micavibrio aeruginosavorus]
MNQPVEKKNEGLKCIFGTASLVAAFGAFALLIGPRNAAHDVFEGVADKVVQVFSSKPSP